MAAVSEKQLNDQIGFLRSLPIFHGLSFKRIVRFYMDMKTVTYQRGQPVFSEKEPVHYVYIILNGSFEQDKKLYRDVF